MINLAPTLVGSDWVKHEARAIRIALDGVSGPIKVKGKEYKNLPVMPGHRPLLDDAKIADVLTYVRNSWGNKHAPVQASKVKQIREATKERKIPYTADELLKVK